MSASASAPDSQYDKSLLKSCGEDVFISNRVEIRRPHLVSVGSHVAIDSGVYVTTALEMGDYIHIAPYVTIIGGPTGLVTLDHFSGIAAGCRIICGTDEYLGHGLVGHTMPEQYRDNVIIKPVKFERFTSIGTNVVVMPGVTIAEGSIVGSNSLVTKSTEPWTVYVGTPARPVKSRPSEKMLRYAREMGY